MISVADIYIINKYISMISVHLTLIIAATFEVNKFIKFATRVNAFRKSGE